jgi:hypothetical protein
VSESSIPEVAVGLAVGIGFVTLFASFFGPPTPKEESTTVSISDFGLTTYYRFSDVESKVLNFEVDWDTSSISMLVDVPQDTELKIRHW